MDRQEEAQREFNLLVLKKKDDQVTGIVTHSSHVAVYVFNKESKDWVRSGRAPRAHRPRPPPGIFR